MSDQGLTIWKDCRIALKSGATFEMRSVNMALLVELIRQQKLFYVCKDSGYMIALNELAYVERISAKKEAKAPPANEWLPIELAPTSKEIVADMGGSWYSARFDKRHKVWVPKKSKSLKWIFENQPKRWRTK